MRTVLVAITASALTLSACTSMGESGGAGGTAAPAAAAASGDTTPEDRAGYVTMAAASDLYEIQSSQLALTKAQRAEVKQFAQMLIDHHTQTTAALTQAARASGMTPPPPALMPMQRQMMTELQGASTANFDQTYLRQQVPAHEMALALHQNYAARGDTAALKTAAAAAVPIVQQHLTQAQTLNR
jgi:putative membrane protein